MTTILIAVGSLVAGVVLGITYSTVTIRRLRRQVKELRTAGGKNPKNLLRSITRFLFVTAQVFAIVWVSWSYAIATYSTIVLEQPFPAEELSAEAVRTILGVGALKVLENIFEHNEGMVFGRSRQEDKPPNEGGEEGGVG